MGKCEMYCYTVNRNICCYECKRFSDCLKCKRVCDEILYKNCSLNDRYNCLKYIEDKIVDKDKYENKDDINNNNNNNNKSKLTINVEGDPDSEHTTIVYNNYNNGIIFYYYNGEGTKYKDICKLLDIVGVEYFTVIKRK